MLKDNLIFTDAETKSKVIFNHYSYCEFVKWIMVKYGKTTYENASKIVEKSFLNKEPQSYSAVLYITHELSFHWAMLLLYGEMYWLKGIPSDFNDFAEEYTAWEKQTRKQYGLKPGYQFLDDDV